jgi:murein DD-endopeptidase MepM/ murein hydrolase activator NlpD
VLALAALLWAVALGRAAWRLRSGAPGWPETAAGWGAAGLGGALALLFGAVALQALASARVPEGRVVDLATPLGPGRYLVAHGGARGLTNIHRKTAAPGFEDWRGQSFALDLLGQGALGLSRPLSGPVDPAAYPIQGAPLVAPCAGRVVAVEGTLPDMPVPEMDAERKLGNHVILACGDIWVVVAHLRQGSLRVAAGQEVAVGAPLAQVGNSGNSSEPHLHVHAQMPGRPDAPLAAEPLPVRIGGRFLVRNDVLAVR